MSAQASKAKSKQRVYARRAAHVRRPPPVRRRRRRSRQPAFLEERVDSGAAYSVPAAVGSSSGQPPAPQEGRLRHVGGPPVGLPSEPPAAACGRPATRRGHAAGICFARCQEFAQGTPASTAFTPVARAAGILPPCRRICRHYAASARAQQVQPPMTAEAREVYDVKDVADATAFFARHAAAMSPSPRRRRCAAHMLRERANGAVSRRRPPPVGDEP